MKNKTLLRYAIFFVFIIVLLCSCSKNVHLLYVAEENTYSDRHYYFEVEHLRYGLLLFENYTLMDKSTKKKIVSGDFVTYAELDDKILLIEESETDNKYQMFVTVDYDTNAVNKYDSIYDAAETDMLFWAKWNATGMIECAYYLKDEPYSRLSLKIYKSTNADRHTVPVEDEMTYSFIDKIYTDKEICSKHGSNFEISKGDLTYTDKSESTREYCVKIDNILYSGIVLGYSPFDAGEIKCVVQQRDTNH